MRVEAIWLCGLAAVLKLDMVYAGQFLLSRPTVAGIILGALTGDLLTGLQLGLCSELILLDHIPVGGYVPPNGVVCAASAFVLVHVFGVAPPFAFLWGLIMAVAYSQVEIGLRGHHSGWNPKIEKEVAENPVALNKWVIKALAQHLGSAFLCMLAACSGIGIVAAWLWEVMPQALKLGMTAGYGAVPWIGMAVLISNLQPRRGF